MKKQTPKKFIPKQKDTLMDELEKIDIATRLCHRMSLSNLRRLEARVFPKDETINPEDSIKYSF